MNQVKDENDNSPVFINKAQGAPYVISVPEDATVGGVIGQVCVFFR